MFVSSLLLAVAAAYAGGVLRVWRHAGIGRGVRVAHALAFACGCIVIAGALLSPLDEWSERLLSAHMIQHELLMLMAAPLVAASAPLVAFVWLLPAAGRRTIMGAVRSPAIDGTWSAVTAPAFVWLLHAIALWVWHLPLLYQAAVESEAVHAVQHLCFFGTAALFWWGIAHGRYGRIGYGAAVVYVFATAVHSGVLGALLTFSPQLWYPLYARSSEAAGLSPLEDQQLAGLLMWVPAGIIFIAGGLFFFASWLRESGRRARYGVALVCLIASTLVVSACGSDPAVEYARLLESAASWSASAQFTSQMSREGLVPLTFVRDQLRTASREVDTLAKEIRYAKDMPPEARSRAGDACERLSALLRDAEQSRALPSDPALADLEQLLRRDATAARGHRPVDGSS